MCARPVSDRHAQPDWIGGGSESRQTMHTHSCGSMPAEAIGKKTKESTKPKSEIKIGDPLSAGCIDMARRRTQIDQLAQLGPLYGVLNQVTSPAQKK